MAAATYDWPRADNNHQAAIAAACDMIRNAVRDLGESEAKIGRNIQRLESRQDQHEDALSRQQAEIQTLQVLVRGMVTKYELEKLKGLTGKPPFQVRYSLDMIGELTHLRAMELIMNRPGTGVSTIEQRYGRSQERFDLCKHFYITEHGLEYLKLRDEVISEGGDG
jgi:hypothetical protein